VYLIDLANKPGQKIDNSLLTGSLDQIKQQVRTLTSLQTNPDYSSLMREIETTGIQLSKNQQRLLREVKEYNRQVSHMPYRIVALMFGFKPDTASISV
jgi:hypothetical protein